MITRRDLDEAISDLEAKNPSMEGCIRLAALYTVRSHLFEEGGERNGSPAPVESIIGKHGDSDFLTLIAGQSAATVWAVLDETMSTLKLTEPRFYAGVMRKLQK